MSQTDLKTEAFVLRRTNYGETDRILNLLTPEGKLACVAKGVRKEKSKLAGGIELFTRSKVVIHLSTKSDMHLLTSAKMETFYGRIISDLDRLELASKIIKELNRVTDQIDSPEFYYILKQSLEGLNDGLSLSLVQAWFNFNVAKTRGEQINLLRDTTGAPLQKGMRYAWNSTEMALSPYDGGNIGTEEIKIMRLMLVSPLVVVSRIKGLDQYLDQILYVSKQFMYWGGF